MHSGDKSQKANSTPSEYARLKALAIVAGQQPKLQGQIAVKIANYAVSEMQRIGFTDEALCGFVGILGFESCQSAAVAIQKQQRGPLSRIAVEVDALTRRAHLPVDRNRGTTIQIRSPKVRVAFRKQVETVTAEFRRKFGMSRWHGRNIVVGIKLQRDVPEAELIEIRRRITEELREFTVVFEIIEPGMGTGGYATTEILPSGEQAPLEGREKEDLTNRLWGVVNRAMAVANLPQFYDKHNHEPARARVPARVVRETGDPSAQNDKAADFGHDFV